MERTEEQKIIQDNLDVTLGGKLYSIAPLVMRYSREWRKKSLPIISFLMRYTRLAEDKEGGITEDIQQAFDELFTTKMDDIIESFFEYARELPREEIEESTTDGEILLAFMEVFNAFVAPLSQAAVEKMEAPQ